MTSLSTSSDLSSSILSWLSAIEPPCTGSVILQQSRKRARSTDTLQQSRKRARFADTSPPSKRQAKSLKVDMSSGETQHGLPSPETFGQQGTEGSVAAESLSSSHPDSLKLPKTSGAIRQTLAMHGMCFSREKLETYTPYKPFYDELTKMLAGERDSPRMNESDAKGLVRWLRVHSTSPEGAILRHIVNALVPLKSRTQKLQPFQEQSSGHESSNPTPNPSNADQQQKYEYGEVVQFSEDHLVYCTDSRLCKDLLPSWRKGQRKIVEKVLEKEVGISEPRPDYCFGLEEDRYLDINDPGINEYTRVLISVKSNVIHPFLIFEGKAARGSLADAENQAIRGGATLVYARRILNHNAGLPHFTGPDKQSFAFSMTLDCYGARIWVHWCEVQPRKGPAGAEDNTFLANEYYETYHMDPLASYNFSKVEDVGDLAITLNNILDWGCLQRKREVDCVLERLKKKEEEERNEQRNVGDESRNKKRQRNDK